MIGFFEDMEIGKGIALGSYTFTHDEIIAFAERFDPQPFHLNEEAARNSLFGGLCASGWHTASIWLKLVVETREDALAAMRAAGKAAPRIGPSPGVRDLKWLKPVFVDDTISYHSTIVEKKNSRSQPGYGLVVTRYEGINQNSEPVISLQGSILIERRKAEDT